MEKLLSRDETYRTNYPQSLGLIVREYLADLEKEGQIVGDADEIKLTKKSASGAIFHFVKTVMGES